MTEAELIEALMAAQDLAGSSISLYLTTVTAYLLVAYFVGASLDRVQTIIISILFIVFAVSFLAAVQTSLDNALSLGNELQEFRPDWFLLASTPFNLLCLIIDTGGVIASLYFMWHIRHPKTA